MKNLIKDLDVETTSEARSALRAMNKLPEYIEVEEVTDYSHFGRMTEKQFEIVIRDLHIARSENRQAYFECIAKINKTEDISLDQIPF